MAENWKAKTKEMLWHARNIFLSGLIALLPVFATIYIVLWLAFGVDSLLKRTLPRPLEIPGIGLLMAIILVFLIGLWTKLYIGRKIICHAETILKRIPLVRAIYSAAHDVVDLFTKSNATQQFNQVVMIDMPGLNFKMLGFVTREDLKDLPAQISDVDRVAVYLPLAYQMGGLTIFVERNLIQPVDMSLQSAIRFVITAGVSKEAPDTNGILPTDKKPC